MPLIPEEIDSGNSFVDVAFSSIIGGVQNSEEDGTIEVVIYLKGKDDNIVLTTATDTKESYRFKDLPPSDYKISYNLPKSSMIIEKEANDPNGNEYNNDKIINNKIGVRVQAVQTKSRNNFVDMELGAITGSKKNSIGNIVYGILLF